MPAGAAEQVVRTFFETLSSGDLEALADLLHDDATWTVYAEGLPGAGTHEGRRAIVDGFLAPVRGMFEPGDPKVDITALVAGESLVAVEARGRGRLAGGPEYRSTYAFFVEVERGKVRALREYMDSLAVSRLLSA